MASKSENLWAMKSTCVHAITENLVMSPAKKWYDNRVKRLGMCVSMVRDDIVVVVTGEEHDESEGLPVVAGASESVLGRRTKRGAPRRTRTGEEG